MKPLSRSLMYLIILLTIVSDLQAQSFLDDLLYPRREIKRQIMIKNFSQYPLKVNSSLGESVSWDQCEPTRQSGTAELPALSNVEFNFKVRCRHGSRTDIFVTQKRPGFWHVGQVHIWKAEVASKLVPNFKFKLINRETKHEQIITIVSGNQDPQRNHWMLPDSSDSAIAWISADRNSASSWSLQIKTNVNGWADYGLNSVAFPVESGIKDFGSYKVSEENGWYVSRLDFIEGVRLSHGLAIVGEKTQIICDDQTCTASGR